MKRIDFSISVAREYDSIRNYNGWRFVLRSSTSSTGRKVRGTCTNELSAIVRSDPPATTTSSARARIRPENWWLSCFVVIHLCLSRIYQDLFSHVRFPCLRKCAWGQGGMITTIRFAVRRRQRWPHHRHHYRRHRSCCHRHRRRRRRRQRRSLATGDAAASRRRDASLSVGGNTPSFFAHDSRTSRNDKFLADAPF